MNDEKDSHDDVKEDIGNKTWDEYWRFRIHAVEKLKVSGVKGMNDWTMSIYRFYMLFFKQAEILSYETGEKAAEVELLRERVQLLEEEVKMQEGKTTEAQSEMQKLRKEGQ